MLVFSIDTYTEEMCPNSRNLFVQLAQYFWKNDYLEFWRGTALLIIGSTVRKAAFHLANKINTQV